MSLFLQVLKNKNCDNVSASCTGCNTFLSSFTWSTVILVSVLTHPTLLLYQKSCIRFKTPITLLPPDIWVTLLFYYASHSISSTGTVTLCFSFLCEPHSSVLSLHIPVEKGFLGLEAAGKGHEDRINILALLWVLCWRLKQQHVVGICKLQCHVGGHLGKHGCLDEDSVMKKDWNHIRVCLYTNLYLVHKVTLISYKNSRHWCWNPMAIALLQWNRIYFYVLRHVFCHIVYKITSDEHQQAHSKA